MNSVLSDDPGAALEPLGATRRELAAWLPLAAASAAVSLGSAAPVEGFPRGADAVLLATTAVRRSWGPATGFALGLLHHWKQRQLSWLLSGYAAVHAARLRAEASATHLLSVGDVVSARGSGFRVSALRNDGSTEDFDPAKFALVWCQARVVDLERQGTQLARLRAAIARATVGGRPWIVGPESRTGRAFKRNCRPSRLTGLAPASGRPIALPGGEGCA